jgi:hypothetical protein
MQRNSQEVMPGGQDSHKDWTPMWPQKPISKVNPVQVITRIPEIYVDTSKPIKPISHHVNAENKLGPVFSNTPSYSGVMTMTRKAMTDQSRYPDVIEQSKVFKRKQPWSGTYSMGGT